MLRLQVREDSTYDGQTSVKHERFPAGKYRTNRSRAQDGSDHDDQHCSIDEVFTHQNMFAWTVLYSKLQATMKLL